MEMPSVTHPTTFEINGMYFKIVSYSELTNEQARRAAQLYYRTHKFKKKDKGKLFTALTMFDKSSANLL